MLTCYIPDWEKRMSNPLSYWWWERGLFVASTLRHGLLSLLRYFLPSQPVSQATAPVCVAVCAFFRPLPQHPDAARVVGIFVTTIIFLSFPLLCGVSSSVFFLVASLRPSFAASLQVRNSDQDQPDPEPEELKGITKRLQRGHHISVSEGKSRKNQ